MITAQMIRSDRRPLAEFEPYGFLIILGFIFVLPLLGQNLGLNLNFISTFISKVSGAIASAILAMTGFG